MIDLADNMEVIISAVDEASSIFQAIADSCIEMFDSITGSGTEASTVIDEIGIAAEESSISADELGSSLSNVESGGLDEAAGGADELGSSLDGAASSADELSNSLGVIEGSMLLSAAEQIGSLASGAEDMAQQMNQASITVGQLATQTGIAEPQMVSMINEISNATFPNDEAMMYVKNLSQMGVESSNFAKSATDIDIINDAFGMGAQATNSMATEMSVLGVNMNDVSSSFNALAYANANTKGGMDNFFAFLRKYDADLKDMGYDIDQTAVIIAGATQKFGGGKAALSGLSNALKEADGDSRKLEEALGLQAGALDNASALTGEYEGVVQQLANEEAEHKTILDQIGAAWEDVSLSMSGVLSPAASILSAVGEMGSFGMTVKGLKELSTTFTELKQTKYGMAIANYAQAASETILSAATAAYGTAVAVLTGEIGLAEAATMAWNAVLAMNPLVLVAVAAVALAVAIYEVGQAFGWWTDVSSMMDAIWAGVQRLWSAFIDHPDVQAIINGLSSAWDILSSSVGAVVGWIGSFFNISGPGNFDIVRVAIDAIGVAWQAMTLPIRTVINVIRTFLTIQQTGRNAARGFVTGVINYIKTLPSRVGSYISSTASRIASGASSWVSNAKSKASAMVNGVKSTVSSLPGTVYNEFVSIGTRMMSAGSALYNKAVQIGRGIVNNLKSAMGIASPGDIYRAIANEFDITVERIGSMVKPARNAASKVGQSIVNGFGETTLSTGELLPYTEDSNGELFNIFTGESYEVDSTLELHVVHDHNYKFENLPEGVSAKEVANMINDAPTNEEWTKKLTESSSFQKWDSRAKNRLDGKLRRAKGRA